MTDIELLPLPTPNGDYTNPYDGDDLENYARANVARATEPLKAEIARLTEAMEFQSALTKNLLPYQDEAVASRAEIEALRAEVEAVWAAMPRDARYLDPPDGGCVPLHEQVRRMAADATRAERLAEALRGMMAEYEALHAEHDLGECQATVDARAALRDHNQEGVAGDP